MQITEVRIRLIGDEQSSDDRLLGFADIVFDNAFIVWDLRIIGGYKRFIAMPCRKIQDRCRSCGHRNHLRAHYCNHCGRRLADNRVIPSPDGTNRLYLDTAHPTCHEMRRKITRAVLDAYDREMERVSQHGYAGRFDDFDDRRPGRGDVA